MLILNFDYKIAQNAHNIRKKISSFASNQNFDTESQTAILRRMLYEI